ncbi:MAG: hypothetical protein V2B20_18140, partial [Pseudomonadota bacterium]
MRYCTEKDGRFSWSDLGIIEICGVEQDICPRGHGGWLFPRSGLVQQVISWTDSVQLICQIMMLPINARIAPKNIIVFFLPSNSKSRGLFASFTVRFGMPCIDTVFSETQKGFVLLTLKYQIRLPYPFLCDLSMSSSFTDGHSTRHVKHRISRSQFGKGK